MSPLRKISMVANMFFPRTQLKHIHFTSPNDLISILRNSKISKSSKIGMMVHSSILKSGYESNIMLLNNLLHFYYSCFSIQSALCLFDEMPERDVVSWNTMISGSTGAGYVNDGYRFYCRMKCEGFYPSQSSFVSVLMAAVEMGSVGICRGVHGESLKFGLSSDVRVGNSLMTSYVKLGEEADTMKVFDEMQNFDEVSTEILLKSYLQQGVSDFEAFELFRFVFSLQVPLTTFALSSLLSMFSSVDGFYCGIQIHGCIVKNGLSTDVSVVNSFITMYTRSYRMEDAVCLFEEATSRDIVTWNSLIGGYAFNGKGDGGLDLIGRFLESGLKMNESTFSSFLSCCSTVMCLENAKKAHVMIVKLRESGDVGADNIILTMYCRCRSLHDSSSVFDTMEERDVVSYNLMIGSFRSHGLYEESLRLLQQIQLEGFNVDEFIYMNLISSCSRLADLKVGEQIHGCVLKTGFQMTPLLGNSFLEMYSRCGKLKDMEKLFMEIDSADVFTWNIMFMGYTNFGLLDRSLQIWTTMRESGVEFNEFSYCAMIDVCSHGKAPLMGEQIHARVKKLGLGSDTTLMNSIITMYSSWGMMEKASVIFEEMLSHDSISWNAMVCGYAQNKFIEESLKSYSFMNFEGFNPNNMTFASILKSCADHSKLLLGLQFHGEVIKTGYEQDVTVSNSLLTMYGKCGEISDSAKIFHNTLNRDVITWNSMICAFAHHGCGEAALDTFFDMKGWQEKPNAVTFITVLSACSHSGLVSEACGLFDSMLEEHGIVQSEEHYTCMVDIFCRAGRLSEAKELIERMPPKYKSCSLIWRTFLSACSLNENVELGREAAEKLLELEPHDSSGFVLLSNIYASAEKMAEKVETRQRMGFQSVKKESGYSWICS